MTGSMPKPGQILAVLDRSAKAACTDAKAIVAPIIAAEAPGGLERALTTRVAKTPTGYKTTVQTPRGKSYKGGATGAQVVRWVTRGTGIYRKGAGPKRPITGKRGAFGVMVLPGGKRVRSVKGQRPNAFLARAEDRARRPVERAMHDGAKQAADALRRL